MKVVQLVNFAILSGLGTVIRFTHAQSPHLVWSGDQVNGNLILQASSTNINWGNVNPADIINRLHDKCRDGTIGCSQQDPISMDTQIVEGGKSYIRTFTLTITESQYPATPPGTPGPIIDALKIFATAFPYGNQSTQHWDQDSEGSSCTGSNNNYCWMPNKSEGDTVQWQGANEFQARFQHPPPDNGFISGIHFAITVKDKDPGPWDCATIVDGAGELAGQIEGIPDAPFKIFSFICDKAFGLK